MYACMHMYRGIRILLVLCLHLPGLWAGLDCLPTQAPPLSWGCRGCVSPPLVPGPAAHPGLLSGAEASGRSRPAPPALSPEHIPPGPSPSTHPSTRGMNRSRLVNGGRSEWVSLTLNASSSSHLYCWQIFIRNDTILYRYFYDHAAKNTSDTQHKLSLILLSLVLREICFCSVNLFVNNYAWCNTIFTLISHSLHHESNKIYAPMSQNRMREWQCCSF